MKRDININNYEEWMVEHIEGALNPAEESQLAEFLSFHPELRAELDMFSQTILKPDTSIVFEGKDALLQKEEAGRVITMASWVRYTAAAAAAVCVLFFGVQFFRGADTSHEPLQRYAYTQSDSDVSAARHTMAPVAEVKKGNGITTGKEIKNVYTASNNNTNTPAEREKMITHGMTLASLHSINNSITSEPMIYQPENGIELPEMQFAQHNTEQKLNTNALMGTNISLNDNNSIVDWWNDAMALGDEVGTVINEVKDKEINPFRKKENEDGTGETKVVTRNVSIFGISYYSRKKVHN
ncbi:MAG: hypothetical protein R2794_03900 [Chitinophagales bacterium]